MKWDSMRTMAHSCLPWLHWTALSCRLFPTVWLESHRQRWTSLSWCSSTQCSSSFATSSSSSEVFSWFRLPISSAWQPKCKRSIRLRPFLKSCSSYSTSLAMSSAVFQSSCSIQAAISTISGQTTSEPTLSKSSLLERNLASLSARSDTWPRSAINTTRKRLRLSIAPTPSPRLERLTWSKRTSSTCSSVNSAMLKLLIPLLRVMELLSWRVPKPKT